MKFTWEKGKRLHVIYSVIFCLIAKSVRDGLQNYTQAVQQDEWKEW